MDKLLTNRALSSRVTQGDLDLVQKLKTLNRTWLRIYLQCGKDHSVMVLGTRLPKASQPFQVQLKRALFLSWVNRQLAAKIDINEQVQFLEEHPHVTQRVTWLSLDVLNKHMLGPLFSLPWSCLTDLKLKTWNPNYLDLAWPQTLKNLELQTTADGTLVLDLPEGLEVLAHDTDMGAKPSVYRAKTRWPRSLRVIKTRYGIFEAGPESLPNLKVAQVLCFSDKGRHFVPPSLEAWTHMGLSYNSQGPVLRHREIFKVKAFGACYEKTSDCRILLEAPNLKIASGSLSQIHLKAPQLIFLTLKLGSFLNLDPFTSLTCLALKGPKRGFPVSGPAYQVPSSVLSLALTEIGLSVVALPPGLRALKFEHKHGPSERVVPPGLEVLQVYSKRPELKLSPLPKLTHFHMDLEADKDIDMYTVDIQDYKGLVPFASLCIRNTSMDPKDSIFVDMPVFGLSHQWLLYGNHSCPGFREPVLGMDPFQVLKLLE